VEWWEGKSSVEEVMTNAGVGKGKSNVGVDHMWLVVV
jgi:hypothetical protein